MNRLLQWIECDEPERRLDGGLERRRPLLMSEELRQGVHGQLPEPVSFGDQPVLEERSAEGHALKEVAAIERGGSRQGLLVVHLRQFREGDGVDVNGTDVESNG